MKKTNIIYFLIITISFNFLSCKTDAKKETSKKRIEKKNVSFSVADAKNDIKFTAYKTTDKVAVGGQFKKIDIISGGKGNSVKEAINNTEFSVPVSSIFTKDTN